jgi:glucosamine-6-phosphate deaminase
MEIIIRANAEEVAAEAYELIAAALAEKPTLVMGLSTGRSPLRLYHLLRESRLDFSGASFFNLDEFVGLSGDHPASFHRFLHDHLLRGLNVPRERVRCLRGDAPNLPAECVAYEEVIRGRGGIDLQLLGVGGNGHIAFNEPGSSLGSRTRIKTLEEKTIADYAPMFRAPERVPRFSLTMGIGTILESRRVLVLATGEEKAEIVHRMTEGPVTAEVPGSALQFHPRTTLIVDEAAARRLARGDYWKWVYQNKWRVGQ